MERRFLVKDEDGDTIRTFLTKKEAKEFIHNKPGFKVAELPPAPKVDLFLELGEALF